MLFFVNGQRIEVNDDLVDVNVTVLQFLRDSLQLTGTKLACHEARYVHCAMSRDDA